MNIKQQKFPKRKKESTLAKMDFLIMRGPRTINTLKKTSSSLLFLYSQECKNCFPCWDEYEFLDHEFGRMKRSNN